MAAEAAAPAASHPPLAPDKTTSSLSEAKQLLRASIQATRFVQAVVNESEGSDHWFASVPPWIHYARVPAMRYRLVYKVVEPSDRMYVKGLGQNVTFHALPGVPGWADQLGPVAILYTGPAASGRRWFVFRKLLPFPGQAQEKAPLLLGLDVHVRRTPRDISRFLPGGANCTMLLATSQGEVSVPLESVRPHERYRFWLAWSHPSHAHAKDVAELRVARGVDTPAELLLSRLRGLLLCGGGMGGPSEAWRGQPYTLIEAQYAEQLGERIGRLLQQRRELKVAEKLRVERRRGSAAAAGPPEAGRPTQPLQAAASADDTGSLLHA